MNLRYIQLPHYFAYPFVMQIGSSTHYIGPIAGSFVVSQLFHALFLLALLVILTDKRLGFLLGLLCPALHVLIAGFLLDNAHVAYDFLCMFAIHDPAHYFVLSCFACVIRVYMTRYGDGGYGFRVANGKDYISTLKTSYGLLIAF